MTATRAFGLTMLVCCCAAFADTPDADVFFALQQPEAQRDTPVQRASLDDYVAIVIDGKAPDGNHKLKLTIVDGAGREAHVSETTITAINGAWHRRIVYGFNTHVDAPGTWWYDLELDGEPLVSESIEITPSRER